MEVTLSNLNKDEIERLTDLYKSTYRSDVTMISAFVQQESSRSSKIITSEWRQRNLDRGCHIKIQRTMLADAQMKSCRLINTVDTSSCLMSSMSKSGASKAVLCLKPVYVDGQPSGKQSMYLEIWNEGLLHSAFHLDTLGIHGSVYTDEMFSTFNWSPMEDKVVYIAERNSPMTVPFSQQGHGNDSTQDNNILIGEQYVYEEDWGSNMSSKRQSVVAVCEVKKNSISVLDGLPSNIAPGQVQWDPSGEGIVGIGIYRPPRRLGIFFSPNRASCMFHFTLDGKYRRLSAEGVSCLSPRFSPDGRYLIWLQRPTDGRVVRSSTLVKCDWSTKEVTTVIDSVAKVVTTTNGKPFHGIFSVSLPSRCWTSDSKYILLNSSQKYRRNSYAANVENGSIWDLGCATEDESLTILDVSEDDFVVCSKTSLKESPILVSLHLPSVVGVDGQTDCLWNPLSKPAVVDETNIIVQFSVYDVNTKKERCYATYYGPQSDRRQSIPLILYVHGGPHSSYPSMFSPSFLLYTLAGFGILVVHYQGSSGIGQDYVDALIGKIGSIDAIDCYMALQSALEKFPWLDERNVVLLGGSYGGFLVLHMISQFPDTFKAAVAANGPTNLQSMVFASDIPDWPIEACGFPYEGMVAAKSNAELWKKLFDASPIQAIEFVKTPTLLVIGKKDERVLPDQGLSYYHMLKEQNVPTKALLYDTTHFLPVKLPLEMDFIINTVIWFKKWLKQSNELPTS